ncbi:MAG: DUF1924 domain-containing protein [Gammaproteobacteria bacterium]|nr:DUF1924 domain-containing protein [Gammaproteobacteria bacterium]
MHKVNKLLLATCLTASPIITHSSAQIDELLNEYQQLGATTFSSESGKTFWSHTFNSPRAPVTRACSSCHTSNLIDSGKHVRTNKAIEPLAQSVNPQRFSDTKKIRKWLKRNCKWTLGRECTAQEKGDILTYLKDL